MAGVVQLGRDDPFLSDSNFVGVTMSWMSEDIQDIQVN
jgi:hypothetical protein